MAESGGENNVRNFYFSEETVNSFYFLDKTDGYMLKYPKSEIIGDKLELPKTTAVLIDNEWIQAQLHDKLDVEVDDGEVEEAGDEEMEEEETMQDTSSVSKTSSSEVLWDDVTTKLLIEQYRELRPLVDSCHLPSLAKMWRLIAEEFNKQGFNHTAKQLLYKWRGLERAYKSSVRIINGRRKSSSKYHDLLDDIMQKYGTRPIVIGSSKGILSSAKEGHSPHGADTQLQRRNKKRRVAAAEKSDNSVNAATPAKRRKKGTPEQSREIREFRNQLVKLEQRKEAAREKRHKEKMDILKLLLLQVSSSNKKK